MWLVIINLIKHSVSIMLTIRQCTYYSCVIGQNLSCLQALVVHFNKLIVVSKGKDDHMRVNFLEFCHSID